MQVTSPSLISASRFLQSQTVGHFLYDSPTTRLGFLHSSLRFQILRQHYKDLNMGSRLGRRMVLKISNWFSVSRKCMYYARLQTENSEEPYHGLGVRSVNSEEKSSDSNSSTVSNPVNLTVSPNLTVKSASEDHSHLSQSSNKGILQYLSQRVNSSKHVHVPKGFLAVCVGQGEESQRFFIPVLHFNHPLFVELLKKVEEEYGFDHQGIIKIRCDVAEFQNVRKLIDTKHKGQSM